MNNLHQIDILFASCFSLITVASFFFIITYGMRLPKYSIEDVANSIVGDRAIGIFYVGMVVLATVFVAKWGFLLTALSTIAMASLTATAMSWLDRRADRILIARGW